MEKLRLFGAVLMTLAVLAAVLSSPALASYDWEDTNPAGEIVLAGQSTTSQVWKTKFGTIECNGAVFAGLEVATETRTSPEVAWTAPAIVVHPTYTGCKVFGFNATWTTTGCNYEYTAATMTEPSGPIHAQVNLRKSGKANCAIHIVAGGGLCSIDIPEKEGIGTVDLTNEGAGVERHVRISSTIDNLNYEGVGGFCAGAGSGMTQIGAANYTGRIGEEQVGIWVT